MTELFAPMGMFRVVAVDTFDGEDWLVGDFETLHKAKRLADVTTDGKQMIKAYVYDSAGVQLAAYGNF